MAAAAAVEKHHPASTPPPNTAGAGRAALAAITGAQASMAPLARLALCESSGPVTCANFPQHGQQMSRTNYVDQS